MKKKSSLTSLRKDNEVKLEDEIKKSVTSKKDRESIVLLWTAISRQRVNENKCRNSTKVLVIHKRETHREKVTRANGGCLGFWRRRRTW